MGHEFGKTRRIRVGAIVCCLTIFLGVTLAWGGEGNKHFLWKVTTKTATAYLFGSVHLAKADFYPLPQIIEDSFDRAAILAVEADPDRAADPEIQRQMLLAALYTDGDTIQRHLSKKSYDLASREAGKAGLPLEQLSRFKPWFLAMTLELLELGRLGYSPEYGLDRHFAAKAKGRKQIIELESFAYQIKLLNGFSDREQELFLVYSIKELAALKEGLADMMHAWRTGDERGMESIMAKPLDDMPETRPIYDKLIMVRNREMSGRIEQLLQSRETSFIVVGAAHLVGKEGIVGLLKAKGYRVEQL